MLMEAAGSCNANAVRVLLAHGTQVNSVDNTGTTSLWHASGVESVAAAALLIKAGAEVNARINDGSTALIESISADGSDSQPGVLQLLLRSGADPNVMTKAGATALSIARKDHLTIAVRILLHAGATR